MQSLMSNPLERVFLSYSSNDEAVVHPIGKLLEASGSAPFIDTVDLKFAGSWNDQINSAIDNCRSMMVFWSSNSAGSEQVDREWRRALSLKKPMIPIILNEQVPLPDELGQFHGVRLSRMFDAIRGTLFQSDLTVHQHLSQDILQGLSSALRKTTVGFELDFRPSLQALYSDKAELEDLGKVMWAGLSKTN